MVYLKELSSSDGADIYEMLKGIKAVENSFTNPVYEMSFAEYKNWLYQQEEWAQGINLPDGYVAQSIYWLYDDSIPIGIGKIRHKLTETTRKNGGNIGCAISSQFRGKGYGNIILELLVKEAHRLGIDEIIYTVDKYNEASKKACLKSGGIIISENNERWYIKIE